MFSLLKSTQQIETIKTLNGVFVNLKLNGSNSFHFFTFDGVADREDFKKPDNCVVTV